MPTIIQILILVSTLASICAGQYLSGRVTTNDGKPVANAVVQPSGMLFSTTTKEDGSFLLDEPRMKYFWIPNERKLVFVVKQDYDLSVSIINPDQRKLDVTLTPSRIDIPQIANCNEKTQRGYSTAGRFVRITFLKKFKIKKTSNFEYSGFNLTIKDNSGTATLHNWVGVYPSTYAPQHLILNSINYDVTRNGFGLDWKGRLADGSYWRYIGGAIGMVDSFSYQTHSESLAQQIDQILATICLDK